MNDFILCSKFGFEKCKSEGNNDRKEQFKFEAYPSLERAKELQRVEIRLLKNEYPYYIESNIEHWCLWKLGGGGIDIDEIEQAVEDLQTKTEYGADRALLDVLHWINPKHLQSIPDIDHAHLLCLRREIEGKQ